MTLGVRRHRRRRSTPTTSPLLPPQPLQWRPSTSPTSTSRRSMASSCWRPWRCEVKRRKGGEEQVSVSVSFFLLGAQRAFPLFFPPLLLLLPLRPSISPPTASRSSTTGSWRSQVSIILFHIALLSLDQKKKKLATSTSLSRFLSSKTQ